MPVTEVALAAGFGSVRRFNALFGEPLATPFVALTHTFPTPACLAAVSGDELGRLGVIRSRQRAIRALAEDCVSGQLVLAPGVDIERTLARLRALPGVGEWTAHYVAMRALGWPDAFPHTDYAIMKRLGETTPRRVLELAEPWRPWRAYAAMHLWNSLPVKEAA